MNLPPKNLNDWDHPCQDSELLTWEWLDEECRAYIWTRLDGQGWTWSVESKSGDPFGNGSVKTPYEAVDAARAVAETQGAEELQTDQTYLVPWKSDAFISHPPFTIQVSFSGGLHVFLDEEVVAEVDFGDLYNEKTGKNWDPRNYFRR